MQDNRATEYTGNKNQHLQTSQTTEYSLQGDMQKRRTCEEQLKGADLNTLGNQTY